MLQVALGWELYERTHDAWMLGLVGLAVFYARLQWVGGPGRVVLRRAGFG